MGGVVNIVTKSGANQFHGDVFEYFRHSSLNHDNKFTEQGFFATARTDREGAVPQEPSSAAISADPS